jgi:hypothetical protein
MDEAKLNLFLERIRYGDVEEHRSAMEELCAKPDNVSALIKLLGGPGGFPMKTGRYGRMLSKL